MVLLKLLGSKKVGWRLEKTVNIQRVFKDRMDEASIVPARSSTSERHRLHSSVLRDLIIGFADGLTVPFALTAGLSSYVVLFWLRKVPFEKKETLLTDISLFRCFVGLDRRNWS